MASEHWFRWHHGLVTDPKWRVIASRCVTPVTVGQVVTVWAAMLENASQASPRGTLQGWDDEDIAVLFGYEMEQVSCIREAMQGKVLDGDYLVSWHKRQPNREDSSADRTREWRERNREATSKGVTHCDAAKRTVTHGDSRGEERREETEEKRTKAKTKPACAPDGGRASAVADLFLGVSPQVVKDFTALRRAKRAAITQTAVAGIRREAEKAGMGLEAALSMCCERGWTGFKAEWVAGDRAAKSDMRGMVL